MYFTILLLVMFILPVPIITSQMKMGTGAYRAILTAVLGVGFTSVIIFIISEVSGASVADFLTDNAKQAAALLAENQNLTTILGTAELSAGERTDMFIAVYQTVLSTLPGTILSWTAVIAYFEYMLMAGLINSSGNRVPPLPGLATFSLPKSSIAGFVVIFVLSWLLSSLKILPDAMLMSNINVIFEFILSVQGLSVIFFFFQRKRWPKLFAVVMALLFFSTAIGKTLLFLLGLLDLLFDFKGRISQRLHI